MDGTTQDETCLEHINRLSVLIDRMERGYLSNGIELTRELADELIDAIDTEVPEEYSSSIIEQIRTILE